MNLVNKQTLFIKDLDDSDMYMEKVRGLERPLVKPVNYVVYTSDISNFNDIYDNNVTEKRGKAIYFRSIDYFRKTYNKLKFSNETFIISGDSNGIAQNFKVSSGFARNNTFIIIQDYIGMSSGHIITDPHGSGFRVSAIIEPSDKYYNQVLDLISCITYDTCCIPKQELFETIKFLEQNLHNMEEHKEPIVIKNYLRDFIGRLTWCYNQTTADKLTKLKLGFDLDFFIEKEIVNFVIYKSLIYEFIMNLYDKNSEEYKDTCDKIRKFYTLYRVARDPNSIHMRQVGELELSEQSRKIIDGLTKMKYKREILGDKFSFDFGSTNFSSLKNLQFVHVSFDNIDQLSLDGSDDFFYIADYKGDGFNEVNIKGTFALGVVARGNITKSKRNEGTFFGTEYYMDNFVAEGIYLLHYIMSDSAKLAWLKNFKIILKYITLSDGKDRGLLAFLLDIYKYRLSKASSKELTKLIDAKIQEINCGGQQNA